MIVTPEGPTIRTERGTIVISGDRIVQIAYRTESTKVHPDPLDQVIDATNQLVIPGLIDAHSHAYGTLIPGLIDHLPLDMRVLFLEPMTSGWGERETRNATLLASLRMIRNGTTTVLENVLQGVEATEPAIQALFDSGIRAIVGPTLADRPFHETLPGYLECLPEEHRSQALAVPVPKAKDLVDSCLAFVRRWHGAQGGRVYVCLSPSAPHRCTDSLLSLIAETAQAYQLPVHTHLLETRVQAAVARRLYAETMVQHIWKLGLLRPGFSAAHSVWLTDRDIDLMAESRVGVCHTPLSNLYLGSGISRVSELLRHKVAVGIGSDGPNCGSSMSLFEVMKLAAVVHRIREPDGTRWISARDAFRMATIGGAQALGLDQEIGSLEVGKKADIVLLNAGAANFVPFNDAVMQLVYGETGSAVETVLINGEVVYRDGRFTRFNDKAVLADAHEIAAYIKERAKAGLSHASTLEPYLKKAYLDLIQAFDDDCSFSKI